MMVDTPGLGCADIERAAKITRDWPELIYEPGFVGGVGRLGVMGDRVNRDTK